uniref:Uncharacterized protein n=1 Tax=Anguilla anguilla TaxID=7936 RepID=A0A0E9QUQ0_ANGAN
MEGSGREPCGRPICGEPQGRNRELTFRHNKGPCLEDF